MQNKQLASLRGGAQAGFTLIELIVVIVILGILAATALPKFADLGQDARYAKLRAARGAVASAAGIVHGRWLADGTNAATATVDGVSIGTTTSATTGVVSAGYPLATAGGIIAAAGIAPTDYDLTYTTGVVTVKVDSASSHANCSFTYTETTGVVSDGPANKSSC